MDVDSYKVETIEEYTELLLRSMVGLNTLGAIQEIALRKGILDEDETLSALAIQGNIDKLLKMHKAQIENVLERTKFKESEVFNIIKKQLPLKAIPKKRRKARP